MGYHVKIPVKSSSYFLESLSSSRVEVAVEQIKTKARLKIDEIARIKYT
jgi:hypothetical protein